jgi:very-short-patch-repair endonuclease
VAPRLLSDELGCLFDSALRAGWQASDSRFSRRAERRVRAALTLADARSESAFETLIRRLLVRAGLAPEALQHEVRDADGRFLARLDMAWPSLRLAVEADGRAHHDTLPALYRDRVRANDLALAGWTILRFTWADLQQRPEWVVAQVRRAIAGA